MSILNEIFTINPFSWVDILCVFLAGGIIGTERQLSGKPIGIRTSILICLSTYIFTRLSFSYSGDITNSPRIIGQIITGIGFLGGGVILTRDGIVIGVTSAACIWILAAIGITIGSNFPVTGIRLSVLTVVVLLGMDSLERLLPIFHKGPYGKRGIHKNE